MRVVALSAFCGPKLISLKLPIRAAACLLPPSSPRPSPCSEGPGRARLSLSATDVARFPFPPTLKTAIVRTSSIRQFDLRLACSRASKFTAASTGSCLSSRVWLVCVDYLTVIFGCSHIRELKITDLSLVPSASRNADGTTCALSHTLDFEQDIQTPLNSRASFQLKWSN